MLSGNSNCSLENLAGQLATLGASVSAFALLWDLI